MRAPNDDDKAQDPKVGGIPAAPASEEFIKLALARFQFVIKELSQLVPGEELKEEHYKLERELLPLCNIFVSKLSHKALYDVFSSEPGGDVCPIPGGSNALWWIVLIVRLHEDRALASFIFKLLPLVENNGLFMLLRSTAKTDAYEGINVLWLMASAATSGQDKDWAVFMDQLCTLDNKELFELLRSTAKTDAYEGINVLWLIASADQGAYLAALLPKLMALENKALLELLRAAPTKGPAQGTIALALIANTAQGKYLAALIPRLYALGKEDLFELLRAMPNEGPNKGSNTFWRITATAAASGQGDCLLALMPTLHALGNKHLLELLVSRVAAEAPRGKSALWLLLAPQQTAGLYLASLMPQLISFENEDLFTLLESTLEHREFYGLLGLIFCSIQVGIDRNPCLAGFGSRLFRLYQSDSKRFSCLFTPVALTPLRALVSKQKLPFSDLHRLYYVMAKDNEIEKQRSEWSLFLHRFSGEVFEKNIVKLSNVSAIGMRDFFSAETDKVIQRLEAMRALGEDRRAIFIDFFRIVSERVDREGSAVFLTMLVENNGQALFQLIPDIEELLLFLDTLAKFSTLRDQFKQSDCIQLICTAYVRAAKTLLENERFKGAEKLFLGRFFRFKTPLEKLMQITIASRHLEENEEPFLDEELRAQRRLFKLVAAPAAAPAFVGSAAAPAPPADASALPEVAPVSKERLAELDTLFVDFKEGEKEEVVQRIHAFLQAKTADERLDSVSDFVGSSWLEFFCSDAKTLLSFLQTLGEAGTLEKFNELGGFKLVFDYGKEAIVSFEKRTLEGLSGSKRRAREKAYAGSTCKMRVSSWLMEDSPSLSFAVSAAELSVGARQLCLCLYIECLAIWNDIRPDQELLNQWYRFLRKLPGDCRVVFFDPCPDFVAYFELVGKGVYNYPCEDDLSFVEHVGEDVVSFEEKYNVSIRSVLAVADQSNLREIIEYGGELDQGVVIPNNPAVFDELRLALFKPREVAAAAPQDLAAAPAPESAKKKRKKNRNRRRGLAAASASVGSILAAAAEEADSELVEPKVWGPPGGPPIFYGKVGGGPGGALFAYRPAGAADAAAGSDSDESAGAYKHK